MKKLSQGIDVIRLNQLVKDLGVRVKVYKSTLCPNMKSIESYDHDINCTICQNQMIDFAPVETLALMQQQNLIEQFNVQGTFHLDEVFATFLSGVTLQTFTRVELLDFEEDFYELVPRQEGTDVDFLKYKATEVLGVFTVVGNVKKEYEQGPHFCLTPEGHIKWISTSRPDDNQIYTVYYRYAPIYRAIKAVHRDRYSQFNNRPDRIEGPKVQVGDSTYVKLPEAWILKRDFLLDDRPQNELVDPNQP